MLLEYGSYGCVYHPGQQCDGTTDETQVTKLINRTFATNEIHISKRIKKIKKYNQYFVPIEKSCLISSSTVKKCKSLYSEPKFMLMTMPFLQSVPVDFTMKQYKELTDSIDILIRNKLVHFDIKKENIIFTPKPFLIDFGISLDMKKISLDSFYMYAPNNYTWPIDVHLLCFMAEHNWTLQNLETVCKDVCKYSPVLGKEYVNHCIQHYKFVVTVSRKECMKRLIKGWKTWDKYALTVLLLENHYTPEVMNCIHYDASKRLTVSA